MNQIGFKNFRKFKELKPQDLGEVTVLVGANNAGKSTLVKGLLLMLDNLRGLKVGGSSSQLLQRPEFRFDANEFHDLGIGTFGRALCNKANKDEIRASVRLTRTYTAEDQSGNSAKKRSDFTITIFVTGDKDSNQTTSTISRIIVWDNIREVHFDFNYSENSTVVEFIAKKSGPSDMKKNLEQRLKDLMHELENLNKDSQSLKAEITEKQLRLREIAEREAEYHERLADMSRKNAVLAKLMSHIDASDPNSYREMDEINARVKMIHQQQRTLNEELDTRQDTQLKEELAHLNAISNNTIMKIANRNAELDKLNKSLEMMSEEASEQSKSTKLYFGINTLVDRIGVNYIVNEIDSLIYYASITSKLSDEDREDPEKSDKWQNQESDKAFISERASMLRDLSEDLAFTINSISAEYISAHSVSQNIFYNTADKNDYLAKVIHRYYRERIAIGSSANIFVKTWMNKFGLGDDYKIESIGGEAYRFYVSEGKTTMDLADKGMGSNQLMILLISLAAIIQKYEHAFEKPFIIIEEPEQNLHPDLQRMLTEMLEYVNNKYKFKFIVETHSEYMIRRSQVLVAEAQFKDDKDIQENCPFKVYYFPKDEDPYDMEYTPTGRFKKSFGKNFYDAAAQDSVALNKIELASRDK